MGETKVERRARKAREAQAAFDKRLAQQRERASQQREQAAQPATQEDLERLRATYNTK